MSLIDVAKWNEAKWAGVFFQHTDDVETYPPILGLMFREGAPAKDIFAALEVRLGKVDERRALRVSIIRGVSAANPSHYAVVIGSRHDDAEQLRADKTLFFISRILHMTPENTKNLDTWKYTDVAAAISLHLPSFVRKAACPNVAAAIPLHLA